MATISFSWLQDSIFRAVGELIDCIQNGRNGRHASRVLRIILLGSFSYCLLAAGFAVLRWLIIVPVGTMGSF